MAQIIRSIKNKTNGLYECVEARTLGIGRDLSVEIVDVNGYGSKIWIFIRVLMKR